MKKVYIKKFLLKKRRKKDTVPVIQNIVEAGLSPGTKCGGDSFCAL